MIARLGALLLLFYALGFVLFAFTLGKPARADASRPMRRSCSPVGPAGSSTPSRS